MRAPFRRARERVHALTLPSASITEGCRCEGCAAVREHPERYGRVTVRQPWRPVTAPQTAGADR